MQTTPDPSAPTNTISQTGRRHRGKSLTVEPSCKAKEDVALSVISDAAKWLQEYQQMMAGAIADGTDGRLTRDKVVELIQTGTTLNSQQAKDFGLIHDILEPAIPADARWWQV